MLNSPKPPAQQQKEGVYFIRGNNPHQLGLDLSGISEEELQQISLLMQAFGDLREVERRISEASARYMKLNETDMRALHYLIVSENNGVAVSAGDLSHHLGISAASTTKLLDRLENGGHVTRSPHPTDRRALLIRITPVTRQSVYATVGKHQARRFYSAARLTMEEREVIIRFLRDTAKEIDISNAEWIGSEQR